MSTELPIVIRTREDADNHFIVDSWARQLHEAMPFSFIPSTIYFPNQIKLINDLLQCSDTLVACLAEDPSIIIGYLTYEHIDKIFVVHWVSVKKDFRRFSVMQDLLSAAHPTWKSDIIITTQPGKLFSKYRKKLKLHYDPFLLFQRFQ